MNRSPTGYLQEQIIDKGLCTYCGACVNLCPYYTAHNDRVVIIDECTLADAGCHDVCPQLPTDVAALTELLFQKGDMTPEAGAIKNFYLTRAADAGVRKNAQHGGTVTALMELALGEGLIDTAVLSGSDELVLPAGVETNEADRVKKSGKSRFVTTPVVAKFNEVVKGNAMSIGIVATPCQTLALAKMRISKKARIRENSRKLNLVIGLFCGWAFSSSALKEMLAGKVDIDSITGMDIPPSHYQRLEVYTARGTANIALDEVVKCVRSCCHYCSDMTAEFSDISVGSARLPEGWDEARSWNQVIVRTEAGQKLLDLARKRGALEFRDAPEGNLERLKKASLSKKKAGEKKRASIVEENGGGVEIIKGNCKS